MQFYQRLLLSLFCFITLQQLSFGQQKDTAKVAVDGTVKVAGSDTLIARQSMLVKDTLVTKKKKVHDPKVAIRRSAILPGWGQVYNKSYWKLPIVYGALGITTYIFIDNLKTVHEANYAIKYVGSDSAGRSMLNYDDIAPYLKPFVDNNDINSLRNVRNQFRQYVDYSALVFILFWGLNVVDATVDAHLKHFDVSPDLSMKIKPNFVPNSGQTVGLSLVFDIHKGKTQLRGLP